ncbi:MAG: efflux RND transporter periplasmic adaptor subunit [Phycisphaerae bacterium]|nr:efflux RND transporter periplasmic adaptor subunit [Phycisphaerae bacterium]
MTAGRFHTFAYLSVIVAACGVCLAEEIIEEAVTKPSKDRTISFIKPGLVENVLVKEDDVVQAGQLLAKLNDAAEQLQLQQLKATAEDTTEIEAEKAQLNHAKVELELQKKAKVNKVATELDVLRAETQVKIAEARVKIAEFKNRMNKLRYQEAKIQLERMELRSPIDGIVDEIAVDEGEAVDTQMRPILRVINIDPMWIDVNVPTRLARKHLRKGQAAQVRFEGLAEPRTGTVIKVSSDADAASDTVRVRVELANPEKRGTGETVIVTFIPSSNGPAAGKNDVSPVRSTQPLEDKTKEKSNG